MTILQDLEEAVALKPSEPSLPLPRKGLAAKLASPRNDPPAKPQTIAQPTAAIDTTPAVDHAEEERKRRDEADRLARDNEEKMRLEEAKRADEARRAAEEKKKAEAARAKAEEDRRKEEERLKKSRAEREAAERKAAEQNSLVEEKRKKDDALKDKLAAVRKNAGGEGDFMSQLMAKKNTPSVSPANSTKSSVKSPAPVAVAPIERAARNSGSSDDMRKTAAVNNTRRRKSIDEDVGYQPSFNTRKASIGKTDPFGVETNEYTPSFSNSQRISRESVSKDKVWAPAGRASTAEKNGLFDKNGQKQLLKRRSSKSKNVIPTRTYSQDDDLEELML